MFDPRLPDFREEYTLISNDKAWEEATKDMPWDVSKWSEATGEWCSTQSVRVVLNQFATEYLVLISITNKGVKAHASPRERAPRNGEPTARADWCVGREGAATVAFLVKMLNFVPDPSIEEDVQKQHLYQVRFEGLCGLWELASDKSTHPKVCTLTPKS
jgi:hypothetical protein